MNNRDSNTPPADEAAVEQQIQNKGLTAPRITPEHIDAQIQSEHYIVAGPAIHAVDLANGAPTQVLPLGMATLTICVLTLRNGFTVTGESNCASPENFNEQIGRTIARRNARDKIWSLEGYALRTQLAAEADRRFGQPHHGHDAS